MKHQAFYLRQWSMVPGGIMWSDLLLYCFYRLPSSFLLLNIFSDQGRYSVVGAHPAMEIVARENIVSVMDHEEERMTEEIVDDPMRIPETIMEGWSPQTIDELPDAFCGIFFSLKHVCSMLSMSRKSY